jgi:hypothetical protein
LISIDFFDFFFQLEEQSWFFQLKIIENMAQTEFIKEIYLPLYQGEKKQALAWCWTCVKRA